MKSPIQLVPTYVLAIFDGESDAGDAGAADDAATATATVATAAGVRTRDTAGKFVVPNTNDPAELRRAMEDLGRTYERDLGSAQSRIGELNAENLKHRNRFKETQTALDSVSLQVQASNQRVLRSDARDALASAGALSTRVVDLFLADMGDKVKIDPKTGEPTGIADALPEWKLANAAFFKAETADDETAEAKATRLKAEADAAKGNSTAKGASTAAATTTTTSVATGGLPDLRTLTAAERKTALKTYQRSLRTH